jgi:predicted RNA-binding protein with PUA domain
MEHLENAKNKEDVKSDLLKYFERIVEPNDKIILIAHNGNRLFFFVYFFYCFISIKV